MSVTNKNKSLIIMHICPINKDFVLQTLFTPSPIFDTPNFIHGPKVSLYSMMHGLQWSISFSCQQNYTMYVYVLQRTRKYFNVILGLSIEIPLRGMYAYVHWNDKTICWLVLNQLQVTWLRIKFTLTFVQITSALLTIIHRKQ